MKQMCPGLAIETASLNNSSHNSLNDELMQAHRRSCQVNQSAWAPNHSNKRPLSVEDQEASKRMKTESRVKEE